MQDAGNITQLLDDWRNGDEGAQHDLFDAVYEHLRALAREQQRRWTGKNETLNTTALVHELYLKLDRSAEVRATDRVHFYRVASKAMRQILINYSRDRRRHKRGGDAVRITFGPAAERELLIDQQADRVLDIDRALSRLEEVDERLAHIAELHFFGGLTYDEIAEVLEIGRATVARDWKIAKGWLRTELEDLSPD